ncbi:MAG TPA: exonuclease SbcCD subunit D [Acidimicrobiales bacterium]|nr:exonuclease SbcCD subunit D [Acidimicrobiales bacterium]
MRILHTSDWHIGRRFEREPLEDAQRAFLAWLAGQVEELGADLVVVAGDVYDRSLPAEEAVALLDEGLDLLRGAGATVAMIPGNHDSARRLGFGARRQALGGVHVFADDLRPPEPWLFEARGEAVAVVAVPFLDPLIAPPPLAATDGSPRARTHAHVLSDFLGAGRDAARARYPGVPSVAVAHAFVAGSAPSDSEKALAIGGTDLVDASLFCGFDYVALGHLHRPQVVGGSPHVAYSGSPLAYSFSEEHPKSIRVVDLAAGEVAGVGTVAIPVGRPVVTLEGDLDALLTDPRHDRVVDHWVAARLTDETTQVQALERLRTRFPHAVSVRYARTEPGARGSVNGVAGPGGLLALDAAGRESPESVERMVLEFLSELSGRAPEDWARSLVAEAVAAAGGELVPPGDRGVT